MSKFVKVISSDHFGAPPLKGDRWGYCVELLRVSLCEGFNERTDLIKFEVLTSDTVKFTFTTNHMYVTHQTIKTSGISYPELNDDFFIISHTDKEVVVKSYQDLTGIVGQDQSVIAKSIVAPLGFIEKFKEGNRSAFTTVDEDAFFYIDDTQPTNWRATSEAVCIAPIVYMTERMTDINTDGKLIFPMNPTQPTWYKERGYTEGGTTIFRNGIMNFCTYPVTALANKGNSLQWHVIGNGKMFYLLINNDNVNYTDSNLHIYLFGRYCTTNENYNHYPYILHGNTYYSNNSNTGVYAAAKASSGYKPLSNFTELASGNFMIVKNAQRYCAGILGIEGEPSIAYYAATKTSMSMVGLAISGTIGLYPDKYTRKFFVSSMNIFKDSTTLVGKLPGLLWNFNGNQYVKTYSISKYRYNNKEKYLFNINTSHYYSVSTSGTASQTLYNISLDYNDWRNYE